MKQQQEIQYTEEQVAVYNYLPAQLEFDNAHKLCTKPMPYQTHHSNDFAESRIAMYLNTNMRSSSACTSAQGQKMHDRLGVLFLLHNVQMLPELKFKSKSCSWKNWTLCELLLHTDNSLRPFSLISGRFLHEFSLVVPGVAIRCTLYTIQHKLNLESTANSMYIHVLNNDSDNFVHL